MAIEAAVQEAQEIFEEHGILPESTLGMVILTLVETNVIQDQRIDAVMGRVSRLEIGRAHV